MFYITYYAKKHKKFITRKGSMINLTERKANLVTSKNNNTLFSYWDLDADGLENGCRKGKGQNMIELFNLLFVESPLGLSIILIVGIIAIGIEGYRSS